jgi:N-acyl-L-homoserine lactone synthetase
MGRVEQISTRKAALVFPELVPQHELDRRGSAGLLKKWVNSYGYRNKRISRESHAPEALGQRQFVTTILSVKNLHRYGDLFVKYLQARREVFIVQKGWQLPETDGMEFDQYDTPLARWIVIHDKGAVLGGARISPTTAVCGNHSYMLRDAQLGRLQGLPFDMLYDEAPVSEDLWEATRLFVTDRVPAKQRAAVQSALMKGMAAAARSVGATQVIGIVPAVFRRWLKRIDMEATAVGPVMKIDGDRVQAALMKV